jgi:prepilin-type N-terminal cleavage/methylation domain-containing protein
MKKIQHGKQKGFTLVELGIVLALIGIGLFFAISKISETNEQSRAQTAATDISLAVNNIKRLYATQNAFPNMGTAITEAELRNSAIFPSSWNGPNAGTLISPFGAAPTANACNAPVGDTGNGTYSCLTITNVPSRVCTEMGRALSAGMVAMNVNGVLVKPWGVQVNPTTLAANCAAAATVPMDFYFTRA